MVWPNIEEGIVDPLTQELPKLEDDEKPVPEDHRCYFWERLDGDLASERNENGLTPKQAVKDALDDWGILHPSNRDCAKSLLRYIAAGRIEAANEEINKRRKKNGN